MMQTNRCGWGVRGVGRAAGLLVAGAVALFIVGCNRSATDADSEKGSTGAGALPAGLLVDGPPPEAREVAEARRTAAEGDTLAVRGRIGGRKQPFVEGRAIFTLADLSIPTCADNPGDDCPTPWDYCCEPPEHLAAHVLTVQVVGKDGRPLTANLSAAGLKPMAEVVVQGRVSQKINDKVLVLDASAIHLQR